MQPSVQVYDVEICKDVKDNDGGWDNPEALGLASAVTYDFQTDVYNLFLHPSSCARLIRQLDDHINVSFNGVMFDSRVILGNNREVVGIKGVPFLVRVIGKNVIEIEGKERFPTWVEDDLLLRVIMAKWNLPSAFDAYKWLQNATKNVFDGTFNLDAICRSSFNKTKTGKGEFAPTLYRQNNFDELFAYNLNDVRITKKLWEFQQKNGFVIDGKDNILRLRKHYEEKAE